MKSRWMLVLAFGLAVAPAWAQKGGVVRLIVPFATGGPTDITARVVAPYLGERTARPWVVEHKVGATAGGKADHDLHRLGGPSGRLCQCHTGQASQQAHQQTSTPPCRWGQGLRGAHGLVIKKLHGRVLFVQKKRFVGV